MPPAFAPGGCENRADVMFCPVFSCRAETYLKARGKTASNASGGGKRGGRSDASYRMNIKADMLFHGTALLHAALAVCASFVWAVSAVPADFLPMGKMPGERREEAVPRTLEDCDRDPAENILFCKLMRMWRRRNSDTCFTISPATVLPCWCAGLEFWTERNPVFQPRLNAAKVNENVRCAHMIGNTGG